MQNDLVWDNMKQHWRTYPRKNKRSSFLHIAASMGGHVDEESGQEHMSGEEQERIIMTLTFLEMNLMMKNK